MRCSSRSTDARFLSKLFGACALACCATAAQADADEDASATRQAPLLRGEVETIQADGAWQSPARAYDPALRGGSTAQRSMLWAGPGSLQLGLGVQQASSTLHPAMATESGRPLQAPQLLVGASLDTSSTTQLRWHTPMRPAASLVRESEEPRVMELSLVLKPQDPLANLRRGSLMKLELGGQTQLSLRPRGGKVMLRLTSQW
ncbi:MAG TPA: hypothetical protein VD932_00010 [Aquabacterium sp.]|nr:hypothetical protein [Aquabacterium sp.]